MIFEQIYQLKTRHQYCLYIQSSLYAFLKTKLKQNPLYLESIIQTHKPALLANRHLTSLEKATCKYQPKTKNYKRIIIKEISPHLWKLLKELKKLSGYSISFIIRVFLEWELQKTDQNIQTLLPNIQVQNKDNAPTPTPTVINNYKHCLWWDGLKREILAVFEDFP